MNGGPPWWWLRDDETRALGLGLGAERTRAGVLFGDARSRVRLEVIARDDAAPLKLGPISVRVWGGDTSDARVVALLHRVGKMLHTRRGVDFRPDELEWAESPRATTLIDVPSVCGRACAFCGISKVPIAERRPRGEASAVERAIDEARGPVLFTGDDAMSHPRIEAWIARAAAKGEVSLVGPPRAGREVARAQALAGAGLARWSSGIFGASARAHDAIAGEPGAHEALREACAALRAVGVQVELIVPMVQPLLGELAAITELGATWSGRPVVAQLYVPDPSVGVGFDAMVPPWGALRDALGRARHASIEGAPPCVVPVPLRRSSARLERSEVEATTHPAPACEGCALRGGCPGIAATSLRAVGVEGLG